MNYYKKLFFLKISPLWHVMHRSHVIVLMIHGVVDSSHQTIWRPLRQQLSVDKLDRGLATLAKHYQFITMDQAVSMLAGKVPLQPYSVVLTFDDGYRNNVTHAIPILRKYNAPATFFLSTGHVERREPFWYDRLDYAIQHLCKEQSVSFAGHNFYFRPHKEDMSRTTFTAMRNIIKASTLPYNVTMKEVNILANILEDNAECRLYDIFEQDHFTSVMSWEEARWVADQGVTIGSHTVDHAILDRIDEVLIRDQLMTSKKNVEQHIGRPCAYFCYPNGNWNRKIVSLVKETGFIAATTTDRGTNKVGDELLTLHRISFPEALL